MLTFLPLYLCIGVVPVTFLACAWRSNRQEASSRQQQQQRKASKLQAFSNRRRKGSLYLVFAGLVVPRACSEAAATRPKILRCRVSRRIAGAGRGRRPHRSWRHHAFGGGHAGQAAAHEDEAWKDGAPRPGLQVNSRNLATHSGTSSGHGCGAGL